MNGVLTTVKNWITTVKNWIWSGSSSDETWWASEDFWRKCAIFVTAFMALILILLTFHTLYAIESGAGRVPAYSVINYRIDYKFDEDRDFQVPVIGEEGAVVRYRAEARPRLGSSWTWASSRCQAKNCMNCHTLLGNGAILRAGSHQGVAGPRLGQRASARVADDPLPQGSGSQRPYLRHRAAYAGYGSHGCRSARRDRVLEVALCSRYERFSARLQTVAAGRGLKPGLTMGWCDE